MDIKQLIQLKTQRVSALKAVIDDDILYAVNNAPPTAEEFEQEQSNRLQRPLLRIQGKSIIMADILEQAARVCKLFSGLGPFCSVFVRTVPNLFGCWGHEILFAWTGDADSGAASWPQTIIAPGQYCTDRHVDKWHCIRTRVCLAYCMIYSQLWVDPARLYYTVITCIKNVISTNFVNKATHNSVSFLAVGDKLVKDGIHHNCHAFKGSILYAVSFDNRNNPIFLEDHRRSYSKFLSARKAPTQQNLLCSKFHIMHYGLFWNTLMTRFFYWYPKAFTYSENSKRHFREHVNTL